MFLYLSQTATIHEENQLVNDTVGPAKNKKTTISVVVLFLTQISPTIQHMPLKNGIFSQDTHGERIYQIIFCVSQVLLS